MSEPSSKREMLDLIRSERRELEAVLDELSEDRMVDPGLEGGWSVKDILAHITWWEQRMVGWLRGSYAGKTPERPAPGMTWDDLDSLNAQTYLENKDRGLGEVMTESRLSYREALAEVEKMTDADLLDGDRFEWRKGDPMWHMVAANTWWHYKEHREDIGRWLEESG
jgi:hypothetical protein